MSSRPVFITFEGIDGCGKSTQADRLEKTLTERSWHVTHTFEPGGTALGKRLREILVHDSLTFSAFAEVLVFAADRRQDMDEIITPALARGDIVVAERFADSSVAYQGIAGGVGEERVRSLMNLVTEGLTPDLTLLLDIDPDASLARKPHLDRIEQRGSYLREVREAYLRMANDAPARWVVIDAARPASEVFDDVLSAVMQRLH